MVFSDCGLEDFFHASVELSADKECSGTITDVSERSCQITNRTRLELHNCNYPYVSGKANQLSLTVT